MSQISSNNLRMPVHAKLPKPNAANQHLFGVAVQSNKVYLPPLSSRAFPGIAARQVDAGRSGASMRQGLALALSVFVLPSTAIAEPCTIALKRTKLGETSSLLIRNEQCPNSDRRVVKVLIQSDTKVPRLIFRKTQSLSAAPFGGGSFIDLETDGTPEVDITGECSAPNCEHELYKLSEDQRSMYHYYRGGYFSVTRTPNFLVTSSYGSYSSWEYLAYDPSPQKFPIENFRYSVHISSAGDSNRLTCKISEPLSRGRLQLVVPPLEELLGFCRHYGEKVQVRILNLARDNSSHANKRAP